MKLRIGMLSNALLALGFLAPTAVQSQAAVPSAVLFENVRIFDGKGSTLSAPSNVLVRGNKIERISTAPIALDRRADTRIIQGGGRTLMPGLIDAHWHVAYAAVPMSVLMTGDIGYINLVAGKAAGDTLMRGFTSVRDVGGPSFGLKRAIDEGLVNGPRIWPSGAMVSQSGGHGDFRMPYEVPAARSAPPNRGEMINGGVIADSPDEVRRRVREQLMLGATQIKLAAGGGVASDYDPIDVSQYTEAEFRAAVEAAENWGTYVTVHAYTPRAIKAAIAAGVRCIEHGQLMDEATARLMADKGDLAQHSTFSGQRVRQSADRPGGKSQAARGFRRHRQRLQAREEVQAQDCMGNRHPLRTQDDRHSRCSASDLGALVHARRGAGDGDQHQRRPSGAVRPAQSVSGQAWCDRGRRLGRSHPRERRPLGKHEAHRRTGRELSDNHEGRKAVQEQHPMMPNNALQQRAAGGPPLQGGR